ncbi:MAG: alpha-N-acetylglucosaminidase C-terminal domain-containing protein [Phycisphaerae bacterium]|nr:alpha-N-acetylglucosaminidase C-terminal domain-containing protein [Phycisphaerae bacterium]
MMIRRTGGCVVVGSIVILQAGAWGSTSEEAARGVLGRLLPDKAERFVFESIPADGGRDVFELEGRGGKIVLRGSNGLSLCSALNWYLKEYCHASVSWCGDQLDLPDPLPTVGAKIRRTSPFAYRYCFNFCAFSYTLAWWDWAQWERMIDWMALHGINMPLSVTGQEAIWDKVYRDMGLSERQVQDFLVGPAYLPFGWMGCIDKWGGPVPKEWMRRHLELERKIVGRQRELGMTPVLQGFTGHVPPALKERFPEAKFHTVSPWCGFPATMFIDPADPLFVKVGKAFIEEQTRQFGTDHLYASDTFIEMTPPSSDPAFLDAMGKAVYGAMTAADPEAKWVMQGWLFVNNPRFWKAPQGKALIGSVPRGRLILIDLFCEARPAWDKTEAFHGAPWIWCIIHNFGGRVGLYGGLPQIRENLSAAMTSPKRGELSGIGAIMEGFGYNPVVYDLLTEMTWRDAVPNLDEWLSGYVLRRYGRRPPAMARAWALLRETVYRSAGHTGSVIFARPGLGCRASVPYDPIKPARAWQEMLACADDLKGADTYRFDLVNLSRQVLANYAMDLHADVEAAYHSKDRGALASAGKRYLELIRDLDALLATRREFLLGKWLSDAKRWAVSDEERRLYEWNARNLITLWGPRDSTLHEYAQRQWSGLIEGFYLRRWEMFLEALDGALASGKAFDGGAFESRIRDWEVSWTHQTEGYPAEPRGDSVTVSRALWGKYGAALLEPEAGTQSLTTGRPASCSSFLPEYPAHQANDGQRRDTNRYWATDVEIKNDKDPWWQVDLEEPTEVGRVVVVFYHGDERHYGFVVETSLDGRGWETVADHRDNKAPATRAGFTCRFAPRQVRYVRVKVPSNSANTGRHLVEVMAFRR